MTPPGVMHATEDVGSGEDLARFLDPTGNLWTRQLLALAAAASPENLAALRDLWPAEIIAWEIWSRLEEIPSAGDLRALTGMVWPSRPGVPDAETIAAMVGDYKHGRITLPARAGS